MPAGDRAVSESRHPEALPTDAERTFAANQCSDRISGAKDPNLSGAEITRARKPRSVRHLACHKHRQKKNHPLADGQTIGKAHRRFGIAW
jgi:hypothetical protein